MAEFQLTQEQKIAQSYDRHLAVNANAGSGKTSVLVRRFINILLENNYYKLSDNNFRDVNVKPSEIVAITFTRKASSEMLSKVVNRVEKIIQDSDNPSELRYLRFIREKLTNARISTIHSFCSEVLKSFPIEAEVSPGFTELQTPDKIKIIKDAVLSVFEDWLESANERSESINTLFKALSKKGLEELINAILGKVEIFESLIAFYQKPNEEIISYRDLETKKICLKIFEGVEELSQLFLSIEPPTVHKAHVDNAKELYQQIIANVKSNGFDEFSSSKKFISDFSDLLIMLYTKNSGTLRSREIQKGIDDASVIENGNLLYQKYFAQVVKLSEVFENSDFDELMIEYVRWILELVEDISKLISEQKEKTDALDFDDLILKTVQLLRNPDVALKVRSKIKYLLVDEFQDTNDIQYEIIRLLIPELTDNTIDSGVNLFIVGDDKQSIYGFRNADVRVFNQARNDIKMLNDHLLKKGKITNEIISNGEKIISDNPVHVLGNISLTSTFRLQPVVASFVNIVCGKLMSSEESSHDVKYSNLTCAKNIEFLGDNKLINEDCSPATKKAGSVSFLLAETIVQNKDDTDENSEDNFESVQEAELLAKYIRKIVASETPLEVSDEKGEFRNATYKDIAILSRKKKQFSALIRAFLDNNIPYIISSGSGFYSSQEILDVISYLNFLTNPLDDLAVSGLLKSDFFKLTDNELFLISKQKRDSSLWENLKTYCEQDPEANGVSSSCHRALSILSDLKLFSSSLTISQNIFRLLEITAWYGSIMIDNGRHQMTSNIDKLIQIARDFENRGFRSLHEFVEYLNFISEASLQESEAIQISDSNAINILTIHAAKGLEFPIVILYSINVDSGKNSFFNISKENGILFSMNVNLQDRIWTNISSPLHYFSTTNAKLIEKAEEKRLLYVAMTRAIDHLVITAALNEKKDKEQKVFGLFSLIMDGLGISAEYLLSNDYLKLNDILPVLKNNSQEYIPIEYSCESIKNISPTPFSNVTGENNEKSCLMLNMELTSLQSGENYSATKLSNFDENIEEYIKKYILGISDDFVYHGKTRLEEDGSIIYEPDEVPANEIGTIVHEIMQRCGDWLTESGLEDRTKLSDMIKSVTNFGKPVSEKILNEIYTNCTNIVSTKLFQTELVNIGNGIKEYELSLPIGDDSLVAKIDLLIKRTNGNFEIWDWKTNRIDNVEKRNSLVKHYELQMKIYCYFLSLLRPGLKTYTAKLLFTRLASNIAEDSDWTSDLTWTEDELNSFGIVLLDKIDSMKKIWNWI